MDPVEYLRRMGGLSAARPLVSACGRAAVAEAVGAAVIVRTGRGRYALPHVEAGLRAAHGCLGVLSHESAAAWWGWESVRVPETAVVTVPRDRKPRGRKGVRFSFRALPESDVVAPGVTSAVRTVLDCATTLPYAEALAIADSAIRHAEVARYELTLAAAASPLRGRARRLRVARTCDGRAANPFESALRAHALDAGLDVEPQAWIHTGHGWVRPDLLDDRRGLAVEAESFTWHGRRDQLTRDCRKYNDLVLIGLTLLRFSWEQVFLRPQEVCDTLQCARTGVARWEGALRTHPAGQRRSA
ncbi:MAG: hypothetical protein ABIN79_10865 [Marmoricola sp.]